jgi:sugar lactone lactonase YvrE
MSILALGLLVQVSVPGQVVDLVRAPGSAGTNSVNYVTSTGEVGRIDSANNRSVLLAAGALPGPAVALYPTPAGADLVLLLEGGDLWRLPAAGGAPTQIYADQFAYIQASDLVIDQAGSHWIASRTISPGTRTVALISANGQEWGYFTTFGQPVGLCPDPLGSRLLRSDQNGGLRILEAIDLAPVETQIGPGPNVSPTTLDGDLVAEADGDVFIAAGSQVIRYNRLANSTSVFQTLPSTVRGLAITGSGGSHSLWVAHGQDPSTVRVLAPSDAAAALHPPAFHTPPTRGVQRLFFAGFNCFELTAEGLDRLWLGGDNFGSNQTIRRTDVNNFVLTTVASGQTGLEGRVEGLSFDRDGQLFALTSSGALQQINTQTGAATTLFSDPLSQIVRGKDLSIGREGQRYAAVYTAFDQGYIGQILGGSVQNLLFAQEPRGVIGDPFRGQLLYSEWINQGFAGAVGALSLPSGPGALIPNFNGLNITNGPDWGDGDVVVDALGRIYIPLEDEFCVRRFDPATGRIARIGSGYLNRPSGVAIARSSPSATSSTGFSLYVTEYNRLWEIPGVPAPAPRWVDPGTPPVGQLRATFNANRQPVGLCGEPQTGRPLVLCSDGSLWRVPLAGAGAPQLLTTITPPPAAIAPAGNGWLFAVERGGRVRAILPNQNFLLIDWFDDVGNQLSDVCDLALASDGAIYLLERNPNPAVEGGRLWRLSNNALSQIGDHLRGRRLRMSPADGLAAILEDGHANEGGELLAVDWQAAPARSGHWRIDPLARFDTQALDSFDPSAPAPVAIVPSGGLCFDQAGNAFVAEGNSGRVWRVAAGSGNRSLVTGHFARPQDLEFLSGSPGVAGPQGGSLFVLDGFSVYEFGTAGQPVPPIQAPVPVAAGALAARAELSTWARRQLGLNQPLFLNAPTQAGRPYLLLCSLAGKEPGLPLASIGDPGDTRILPQNFDPVLWVSLTPPVFNAFAGVLNGAGSAQAALLLPNSPSVVGLGRFLDLVGLIFDFTAINSIGRITNTAALYLGS